MKSLDLSLIQSGKALPGSEPVLDWIQSGLIKEMIEVLGLALSLQPGNNQILYGCDISGSGGGPYNIAAGAIIYNGEIYLAPAVNGLSTGPASIYAHINTVTTSVVFSDNNPYNVLVNKTIIFNNTSTGAIFAYNNVSGPINELILRFILPPPWNLATLVNSWANTGGALNLAQYAIDGLGNLRIRGVIQGGSNNTVAFTLPVGYRPLKDINFTCCGTLVGGYPGLAQLRITASTGDVTIYTDSTGTIVDFGEIITSVLS